MANGFQRDIGAAGTQGGTFIKPAVKDTSAQFLAEAAGGIAAEAYQGAREAKYYNQATEEIEDFTESIAGLEQNRAEAQTMLEDDQARMLMEQSMGLEGAEQESPYVKNLQRDFTNLRNAIDQGVMSKSEFLARTRLKMIQAMNENPAERDRIRSMYQEALSDHADIIDFMTAQRDAQAAAQAEQEDYLRNSAEWLVKQKGIGTPQELNVLGAQGFHQKYADEILAVQEATNVNQLKPGTVEAHNKSLRSSMLSGPATISSLLQSVGLPENPADMDNALLNEETREATFEKLKLIRRTLEDRKTRTLAQFGNADPNIKADYEDYIDSYIDTIDTVINDPEKAKLLSTVMDYESESTFRNVWLGADRETKTLLSSMMNIPGLASSPGAKLGVSKLVKNIEDGKIVGDPLPDNASREIQQGNEDAIEVMSELLGKNMANMAESGILDERAYVNSLKDYATHEAGQALDKVRDALSTDGKIDPDQILDLHDQFVDAKRAQLNNYRDIANFRVTSAGHIVLDSLAPFFTGNREAKKREINKVLDSLNKTNQAVRNIAGYNSGEGAQLFNNLYVNSVYDTVQATDEERMRFVEMQRRQLKEQLDMQRRNVGGFGISPQEIQITEEEYNAFKEWMNQRGMDGNGQGNGE